MPGIRLAVVLAILVAVACSVSFSTANIATATLSTDSSGTRATTSFGPGDTFYCVVKLANAPEGTKVKAVWTAVAAGGVENHEIDSVELETGSAVVDFKLENNGAWPPGSYKVDLYLDGKFDRSLPFEVEAAGGM